MYVSWKNKSKVSSLRLCFKVIQVSLSYLIELAHLSQVLHARLDTGQRDRAEVQTGSSQNHSHQPTPLCRRGGDLRATNHPGLGSLKRGYAMAPTKDTLHATTVVLRQQDMTIRQDSDSHVYISVTLEEKKEENSQASCTWDRRLLTARLSDSNMQVVYISLWQLRQSL